MYSISFANQNTGWIVGDSGIILKTTTGGNPIGIKPISNNIPSYFKLYQNYPNPFNPSTTIEFDISQTSFIRLIVYDLNGRELQTLVNEELNAGSYRVSFDGNKLSSGLYFYRLFSDGYIHTKKMVLIK